MRPLLLSLVVTVAALAPARALAAGPADVAAADALFREARAAAKRGDYATACPKFRESYRLDPTVGTLLNTADCEEHDGRLVDALLRFQEALGRLASSDDRVTYVRSRIHALEERVPRIVATLPPSPSDAGLRVLVDGVDATSDRRPLVIRVEPGAHELRVVGPGRDERHSLVLRDGEGKEIDLSRPAPASPEPARPPEHPGREAPAPAARSNTALALTLGGVGVAALAASGVAVVQMFHEKKTADAHCNGSECDQTGIDATAAGKRWGTLGGVAFGLSAAALGVGTFLFFQGREPAQHIDKVSISFGPSVGPGGGGLVVGGRL